MADPRIDPPIAMLAELTHRCPLACPYCSNPLELAAKESELSTETWARVFHEAAELGVLQLHLFRRRTGCAPRSGRPCASRPRGGALHQPHHLRHRPDPGAAEALVAAGLDHIQLSVQGVRAGIADRIGGYKGGFDRKMELAGHIADLGIPLTLNAVMHRHNLDDLPATLDLALTLGARRIEVACVQFQGWALKNRAALQPSREQVDAAKRIVAEARARHAGRLVIDFVPPDYYADFPKACMGGWGSTGLNIAPDGTVLPCHAAQTIPGLACQNVATAALSDIWYHGPAFAAFRGTEWMPELCRTCDRRDVDFGGCRCQAMAVLGDPAATDPVCRKSPGRARLDALLAEEASSDSPDFTYRRLPRPVTA